MCGRRPMIFQTLIFQILIFQKKFEISKVYTIRFEDTEIRASEFVAKTQLIFVLLQGINARKVNCGRVYSAYILRPVLSGRNL